MIGHNAPTNKLKTTKLSRSPHHINKFITLLILQKINAMRNATNQMMNSISFFRTIIRIRHTTLLHILAQIGLTFPCHFGSILS